MTTPFKVPTRETMAEWDRGVCVSDDNLDEMQAFLANMLEGAQALGDRFALATMALRSELTRAEHMLRARRDCVTDIYQPW